MNLGNGKDQNKVVNGKVFKGWKERSEFRPAIQPKTFNQLWKERYKNLKN